VCFSYEPASFRIGACLTLAGLAFALGSLAASGLARRQRRAGR
jgi:hypothetical protein